MEKPEVMVLGLLRARKGLRDRPLLPSDQPSVANGPLLRQGATESSQKSTALCNVL